MLTMREENAWFENNYETFNDQLIQMKNEIENLRNKNEILVKENVSLGRENKEHSAIEDLSAKGESAPPLVEPVLQLEAELKQVNEELIKKEEENTENKNTATDLHSRFFFKITSFPLI